MARRGATKSKMVRAAPTVAAVLGVALLAVAAADLVLAFLTPVTVETPDTRRARSGRAIEADLDVLMRTNLFEGAPETQGPTPEASLPVTTLQLKLKSAYRLDEGQGSAVIETPSGGQRRFLTGEEIIRGVTLDEVRSRAVVISRNGRREVLPLESYPIAPEELRIGGQDQALSAERPDAPTGEGSSAQTPSSAPTETIEELAGPLFPLLARQGAEPGDVPLAVNGRSLSEEEGWESVLAAIRAEGRAVLTVQRGEEERDITITVPSGISL